VNEGTKLLTIDGLRPWPPTVETPICPPFGPPDALLHLVALPTGALRVQVGDEEPVETSKLSFEGEGKFRLAVAWGGGQPVTVVAGGHVIAGDDEAARHSVTVTLKRDLADLPAEADELRWQRGEKPDA